MKNIKFNTLIKQENIDQKKVKFSNGSEFIRNKKEEKWFPRLIIIKNGAGRLLFNHIVKNEKIYGEYVIPDTVNYPYYILMYDYIVGSPSIYHIIDRDDYKNLECLSKYIMVDDMIDDFDRLKTDFAKILRPKHQKDMIERIKELFQDGAPGSYDAWDERFSCGENAEKEIQLMLKMAKFYKVLTKDRFKTHKQKRDIFNLIIKKFKGSSKAELEKTKSCALTKKETIEIIQHLCKI